MFCVSCVVFGLRRGLGIWKIGSGHGFLTLYTVLTFDGEVSMFIAHVVKSSDTVDRGFLDRVLNSSGLAAGLWQPWTRDGGIAQGAPSV